MNIKSKLTLAIGVLVAMIVLLVVLSVVNLQILTATEPDSPAAGPGLQRALLWIYVVGAACICIGIGMWLRLPASIDNPIKELTNAIQEIANHNYKKRLELSNSEEFSEVSKNFNRMAKRLEDYHASALSDMMASKKYMETIINSINEPIIGLNNDMEILFINDEALNVINLKREEVIKHSAQDISLRNDLLRRLIRELVEIPGEPVRDKEKEKKEVLSMLLADLKNYEINNRVELTDEAAAQVVLKQIKQLKETLSLTPADRTDIINECNFSISVLQNYAPEMMDKDAIEKVIKETLAELSIEKPTPKDKGAIMKTLMPKVKGKADGKLVNEVLASMM